MSAPTLLRFAIAGVLVAQWAAAPAADDPPAPGVHVTTVHGAALAVTVSGTTSSHPAVVFLHGGLQGFDGEFAAQRADFGVDRIVVGIDQRGHGRSADTAAPYTYRGMAEDTAAVVEQLGLAPVDLVGSSDGADVALLVAALHPALVRRVVAASPNSRADAYGADAMQRLRAATPDVMSTHLPPEFRQDYERESPDGPGHWLTHVEKSRQLWLTEVVITPQELASIRAPVLVMAGDHDFAPLTHTASIFQALPKGQLLVVPDTSHDPLHTRPAEVDTVVRRFLDSAP